MRKIYVLFAVLLVLAFLLGLFINKFNLTGNVVSEVENDSAWTKAICNDNKCIDVLITCKDGNVEKINPVSDMIYFGNDTALRGNSSDKLC